MRPIYGQCHHVWGKAFLQTVPNVFLTTSVVGIEPPILSIGVWFYRCLRPPHQRGIPASAHSLYGKFAPWSSDQVFSASVQFILSANPLDWGVCHIAFSCDIPFLIKNSWNSSFTYLPPPSVCRVLICLPIWFSAQALYCLNASKAACPSFFCRK